MRILRNALFSALLKQTACHTQPAIALIIFSHAHSHCKCCFVVDSHVKVVGSIIMKLVGGIRCFGVMFLCKKCCFGVKKCCFLVEVIG